MIQGIMDSWAQQDGHDTASWSEGLIIIVPDWSVS